MENTTFFLMCPGVSLRGATGRRPSGPGERQHRYILAEKL